MGKRLFPAIPIPEELAFEFLGVFARMEYALKSSGFARGGNNVEADWDSFGSSIDWRFSRVKSKDFRTAVDFLLGEPPRKQVLRDGRLGWKDAPPPPGLPKVTRVLLMVRRVRNNLFHGAKVWSPEYRNRERDINLLNASLLVLKESARLNRQVEITYDIGAF